MSMSLWYWTQDAGCGLTSAESKVHLPQIAGDTLPNVAKEAFSLVVHVQFVHQDP